MRHGVFGHDVANGCVDFGDHVGIPLFLGPLFRGPLFLELRFTPEDKTALPGFGYSRHALSAYR